MQRTECGQKTLNRCVWVAWLIAVCKWEEACSRSPSTGSNPIHWSWLLCLSYHTSSENHDDKGVPLSWAGHMLLNPHKAVEEPRLKFQLGFPDLKSVCWLEWLNFFAMVLGITFSKICAVVPGGYDCGQFSLAILLLWAILPFGEEALIYKWQPRNLCLSPILSTLGIPSTYMFGNAQGPKKLLKGHLIHLVFLFFLFPLYFLHWNGWNHKVYLTQCVS
jgi:hypothetical protein